jgi:hypothetical protein
MVTPAACSSAASWSKIAAASCGREYIDAGIVPPSATSFSKAAAVHSAWGICSGAQCDSPSSSALPKLSAT